MNNLIVRSLTGAVLVVLTITCLFLGEYTFGLLFTSIMFGMLNEFFSVTKSLKFKPNKIAVYIISFCIFIMCFLVASKTIDYKWTFLLFPTLLIPFMYELFANKKSSLQNIALSFASIIYIAIPISLTNFIIFSDHIHESNAYSPNLLITLIIIIWTYDSFAYLFGISLGKNRMFERISPKKSWEGAIGGLLSVIAVSYFISNYYEISVIHCIAIGVLTAISSTLGDLTESMIKRQFSVKDSGKIFPGHGGLLDRFDSLLFAIPVYVCYLELLGM